MPSLRYLCRSRAIAPRLIRPSTRSLFHRSVRCPRACPERSRRVRVPSLDANLGPSIPANCDHFSVAFPAAAARLANHDYIVLRYYSVIPMSDQNHQKLAEYQALAEFRYQIRCFLHFSEQLAREAGVEPQQHQLMLAVKGAPADVEPRIGYLAERLQIQHHSAVELTGPSGAQRPDPENPRQQRPPRSPRAPDLNRRARAARTHRAQPRRAALRRPGAGGRVAQDLRSLATGFAERKTRRRGRQRYDRSHGNAGRRWPESTESRSTGCHSNRAGSALPHRHDVAAGRRDRHPGRHHRLPAVQPDRVLHQPVFLSPHIISLPQRQGQPSAGWSSLRR